VFNLGAPRAYSLLDFVAALREHCQFQTETVPFPQDKKIIDIGDYYGDFSSFQTATGWAPRIDLQEGVARSVAFYRQHRDAYWV
jgi:nucleoside-diphosphate-sugar epimerase